MVRDLSRLDHFLHHDTPVFALATKRPIDVAILELDICMVTRQLQRIEDISSSFSPEIAETESYIMRTASVRFLITMLRTRLEYLKIRYVKICAKCQVDINQTLMKTGKFDRDDVMGHFYEHYIIGSQFNLGNDDHDADDQFDYGEKSYAFSPDQPDQG